MDIDGDVCIIAYPEVMLASLLHCLEYVSSSAARFE